MIKIKKIIFLIIKSALTVVMLLTLVLFFYAAFFYEPPSVEENVAENKITKNEELPDVEEEKKLKEEEEPGLKDSQTKEKISETEVEQKSDETQGTTKIEDGLFATVGNRAITMSDIVNEVKLILILNNMNYSSEIRDQLRESAIKTIIKRNIKEIELEKNDFLKFSQQDFNSEINRLASRINMDVETLKNICASNELDFSLIKNQVKTELLWNSLIFHLYRDRLKVNVDEINEELKLFQNKKEIEEYLISEIIVEPVEKNKLESKIKELKNKIKIEGFEKVAMNLSISESAIKGGDLGWLSENVISKKFRSKIVNTPVGNLSDPILLPEGILIFKVRDKKKIKREKNLEEIKNQLVNSEKSEILNLYSLTHYDNLRRSVAVKFVNE